MRNHGQNRLPNVDNHIVNLTLNLAVIAIVYVVIGAVTATVIRAVCTRFNEDWMKQSLFSQLADVGFEVSFLVVISFWVTYVVHFLVPVLPVDPRLEHFIELYGGRMVFVYAVFLFVRDLDDKMLFIYDRITGDGSDHPSQGQRRS
jgi:hypothetical protein